MKNTFKLMGIALLAGAMLFAGCKKDEENNSDNGGNNDNPPVEETTNVVFGTQKWDAGYVNAQMAQNGMVIAATKAADHQSFPMIQLFYAPESGNLANGTYNSGLILDYDEQSGMVNFEFGNPYLWYFENNYIEFQSGTKAGDWMSRRLDLTISALDLDNMKASIVANATMSRITDLFEGEYMTSVDLDDCQSRDITVTFNNLQFQAASKAMPATKAIAKMK